MKHITLILHTPMLSTIILSKPKGPSELFTMFAIDWAAMTGGESSGYHSKNTERKLAILVSDVLTRDTVTSKECTCSWITLKHWIRGEQTGSQKISASWKVKVTTRCVYLARSFPDSNAAKLDTCFKQVAFTYLCRRRLWPVESDRPYFCLALSVVTLTLSLPTSARASSFSCTTACPTCPTRANPSSLSAGLTIVTPLASMHLLLTVKRTTE